MKTGIKFDYSEVEKNLKKFGKISIEKAEVGMATAGSMLLRDAIMEKPTVPILEGVLRGSGSVIVENKLIQTAAKLGYGKGEPITTFKNKKKGDITATAGFNTPYAAKTHEVKMKFTEPSAGRKWLESKMKRFKKDYFQAIVDKIKETFK